MSFVRRRHLWLAIPALAGVPTMFAACADDRPSFAPSNVVDPVPFDPPEAGAPTPPTCQATRCSRDLKKVLHECDDGVVETCAAHQGCGDGKCVDACRSAELSKGSAGCAFWTMPPDLAEGTQG